MHRSDVISQPNRHNYRHSMAAISHKSTTGALGCCCKTVGSVANGRILKTIAGLMIVISFGTSWLGGSGVLVGIIGIILLALSTGVSVYARRGNAQAKADVLMQSMGWAIAGVPIGLVLCTGKALCLCVGQNNIRLNHKARSFVSNVAQDDFVLEPSEPLAGFDPAESNPVNEKEPNSPRSGATKNNGPDDSEGNDSTVRRGHFQEAPVKHIPQRLLSSVTVSSSSLPSTRVEPSSPVQSSVPSTTSSTDQSTSLQKLNYAFNQLAIVENIFTDFTEPQIQPRVPDDVQEVRQRPMEAMPPEISSINPMDTADNNEHSSSSSGSSFSSSKPATPSRPATAGQYQDVLKDTAGQRKVRRAGESLIRTE
jgi:hypothetical protein